MIFSEKLVDYFQNPRNLGELTDPTAIGGMRCSIYGDIVYFYLRIEKENGYQIIKDISFQTFGCAISVAASSFLTELVKGKTLQEAEKVSKMDIASALDIQSNISTHFTDVAKIAFMKAIQKYDGK
ncbi:MAG: iron-sulfur cluster assembly scaffold protein [Promethearchaeota archaeon]|nr:MAG: iron-sulfur cluster assembly scaffold protein [Candidatus Lokiarchaeota archaeon]